METTASSASRVVPGISVTMARSAEQRVEERRLAGVGAAGEDGERALAQQLALPARWRAARRCAHLTSTAAAADALRRYGRLVLLGEVDGVREQRLAGDQRLAQRLDAAGEAALHLVDGGAVQRARTAVDQVEHGLRLQQVQLAVQIGAARELSRLGRRAPAASSASRTSCGASAPPWVAISTVSSPV
jgi:hypothetical protein